jgi:hypothetical protein
MKDEFIEYGKDIHPVEAEFFKELMLLCAKYGVKLKPDVFTTNSATLGCNEPTEYAAIEFEFRDSSFINDSFDINAEYFNSFQNLDDDRDRIGINGIPVDERKIWYSKINSELADEAFEVIKHFNDGTLEEYYKEKVKLNK